MKIVIDTNVIIASFAARGFCNELFELCISEHEVYLSDYIIKECRNNFQKKIKVPDRIVEQIIDYLKSKTSIIEVENIFFDSEVDKKDQPIIETAVKSKAKVIITGDKGILKIKRYKNIRIMSPRDFWEYLSQH